MEIDESNAQDSTPVGQVDAVVQMPFDEFDCDQCGACCQSLIVEAHEYDARREPKLYKIGNVDRQKLRDGEHCVVLYDSETKACPFLTDDAINATKKACGIYKTSPVACVMVEAGDAKCQQARRTKGLPLLKDRSGNAPTKSMLESSCEDYGLDLCEVI